MRPLALAFVAALGYAAQIDGAHSCAARAQPVGSSSVYRIEGPQEDRDALWQWRRGVGPPLYVPQPAHALAPPPDLRELVVLTWNAHLGEGRLADLIEALRRGELTGSPVEHFVLLAQEVYRRGPDVPPFASGARSAQASPTEEGEAADASEYAATLGLSMLYVPSMRNGAEYLEDRGNAILSTETLSNALSMELPLERQRRVAVGASVEVMRDGVTSTLRVVNVHLETLNGPRWLGLFRNPRTRQVRAILGMLSASRFDTDVAWAGTVLGGDFNTIKAGIDEPAYRAARAWGINTGEDPRSTHRLGWIDHIFYRMPDGWAGSNTRVEEKFGSDHHPVLGRFTS